MAFLLVAVGVSIWNIRQAVQLAKGEGPLKRGFKVATDPLSHEVSRFLDRLPGSIETSIGGVYKKGHEVVLVRTRRADLIGYINLTGAQAVIEYRALMSTAVRTLASAGMFALAVAILPEYVLMISLVFVIWLFSVGLSYFQGRKLLLGILGLAMSDSEEA